ncbi:GNAT family N-acetyltransferase [Bacillus sp. DX1.1]|uniref:GNAT family N-acetyltransferase n=1 Tax=unclassified Bacillus (in: firmicutes) TaxID=185979 RepID=UPI00256FEF12|nr:MULTISPECIES: GNAT family N-acetyltransferase [unclassified Bacillus (in: firmicutes)]MDM5154607.1 GNAT family N-acetyltransferase [Bacillus sp. DX1.1]WJE83499.1 GNAT family N-acetyltransferase [Bacillus sp. DX3.1]
MIREILVEDAAAFLQLGKQLDEESTFMLLEPGERDMTIDQQKNMIKQFLESENSTIFVAIEEGRLVGFLLAAGGKAKRNQHAARIVIGILQEYARRGLGTTLFKELEKWARIHDVWRLELTAMAHNTRAQVLYSKVGFEEEGVKKDSLIIAGKSIDEYYMAKLLK